MRYSKLNSDGYIQRGFIDHNSLYLSGAHYTSKSILKIIAILGEEHTGITWWGVPAEMIDSIRNFNPAGEYYDDDGNQKFYDGQTDNYWQNHYQLMYSREINKNLNVNAAFHLTTSRPTRPLNSSRPRDTGRLMCMTRSTLLLFPTSATMPS